MKRFTITPQPKKSIKLPSSTIKPTPFPRMSMSADDTLMKEVRNTRDKNYRANCIENIMKFLGENGFDYQYNHKMLSNPSNKEFQAIFKFIYSFIDATPFVRFEEDVLAILKIIKYPYSNEITKSQLAVITPHTWPVVLSMISWIVDLIKKTDETTNTAATVESEFFEYICEGYSRFMDGEEDDTQLENNFLNNIAIMHSKEIEENTNRRKEIEVLQNELENIKSKVYDLDKLENKKRKINEDLNALIINDKQLDLLKIKYVQSIEKTMEEVGLIESQIDELIRVKNDLTNQVNSQSINTQDIKEMNIEKVELFKELEKIKPERDNLTKSLKNIEKNIEGKIDDLETIISEIRSFKTGINIELEDACNKGIDYSIIVSLEGELAKKREAIVEFELNQSVVEDKVNDKTIIYKDFEDQYNHMNSKLQTIGSIYLEKKEISERANQKNRNELDRLENELLKLKLDSDSLYLKTEKDCSEAKIKMDILNSHISREKEEIKRMIWDFYNEADSVLKGMESLEKDFRKLERH